jgi:hypothetical protein
MREQRMEQGVHGISTRKVYPFPELLRESVRSYRTFSPLPPSEVRGARKLNKNSLLNFLGSLTSHPSPLTLTPLTPEEAVIFCDPFYALFFPIAREKRTPPVRWCGALCCPDFPPRFRLILKVVGLIGV